MTLALTAPFPNNKPRLARTSKRCMSRKVLLLGQANTIDRDNHKFSSQPAAQFEFEYLNSSCSVTHHIDLSILFPQFRFNSNDPISLPRNSFHDTTFLLTERKGFIYSCATVEMSIEYHLRPLFPRVSSIPLSLSLRASRRLSTIILERLTVESCRLRLCL